MVRFGTFCRKATLGSVKVPKKEFIASIFTPPPPWISRFCSIYRKVGSEADRRIERPAERTYCRLVLVVAANDS